MFSQPTRSLDLYIGKRIATKRQALSMTQAKLAEQLNVSVQDIRNYEKGIKSISIACLWQVSKILNTPIKFFYGDENEATPSEFNLLYAEEILNLIKAYQKISDQLLRQKARDLINALAEF